jgi:hypothetical protein
MLISLAGVENLESIGGYLVFEDNSRLVSLAGLENLTEISGEGLGIWRNDGLASLEGLDNVDGGSIDNLVIFENPLLSNCAVQSICDRLASSYSNVEIYDNAPGCNNPEEVEEGCETVSLDESAVVSRQSSVKVYPNPTSGIVNCQFGIVNSQRVTIKIYDLHGRQVATVVDEVLPPGEHTVSFDATHLLSGVYIYRQLAAGNRQSAVGKLIKF